MKKLLAILLLLVSLQALAAFDEPECLQDGVDFWESVYTEHGRSVTLLHDQDTYEVLDVLSTKSLKPKSLKELQKKHPHRTVRLQQGVKELIKEGMERAEKYKPVIDKAIAKSDLPSAISYLPFVESAYNPKAKSKVGARGIFQIMPSTARLFGVKSKQKLHDVAVAAKLAVKILQQNYKETGSWALALTAYNHGLGGVKRAVKETGTTDFCKILESYDGPRFKFASKNFYSQFLAIHRIMEDEEAEE